MSQQTHQLVIPTLPERFSERLEAMGVTLALAQSDGRVIIAGSSSPIESLITQAPSFAAALRMHWKALAANPGQPLAVWPGVWLVPIPQGRRRKNIRQNQDAGLALAVFVGHDFFKSEQFHLICDQNMVDSKVVAARVDPGSLISDGEIHRISKALTFMQQDTADLDRRADDVVQLSQQLGESYEELSLLYKLSSNMAVDQPPEQFLQSACLELQEVVGMQWMALLLSEHQPGLIDKCGELVLAGKIDASEPIIKSVGRQLLSEQPPGNAPRVIDDTRSVRIRHLNDLARHVLVIPLVRDSRPFGVLFAGDKLDGSHLNSVDAKLCSSLANSLSIFLQNTMLFEDMHAMFLGTLHALTSSIDAKDSYTHGHSERVALMSRMLAEAAGLDDHTVDRIYIAGLVHDVGKIGVPETVLCKPGALTEQEFELIKMHPQIGARILEDIKQMQDLIPGVMHHHERWDGRGYPNGLAGERIPLFGRVIGLADAFDAMSSNRTYRRSMQPQQVMEEIQRCAGTQFDPKLAQIFTGLDLSPLDQIDARHQPMNHKGLTT